MNPLDYTKAFTNFWTAQGDALKQAQEQAAKALGEGMQALASGAMPKIPGLPTDLSGGVAELTRAGQSLMELWSAATAMCGKLATSIPATAGSLDATVEATFRKIADPRSWLAGTGEMDDVLGRMAEGPRFADLWEIERLYARVLQAWMNLRRRGLEHNAVALEAWLRTGRRFTEQLAGRTGADTPPLDAKAALALWTETANQQLLESQRSEAFLQTQAAMIRATTDLRLVQQELVEHVGKQYGFPTRSELDDVHRTVTDLRREVRAMRRQLASAPAVAASAPAVAASAPAVVQSAATEQAPAPRAPRRSNARRKGAST